MKHNKYVGLEAPHYDDYFVAERTKDGEYGWSVDVPLCLEGLYVFLYDQKRINETDSQKVHIPFGCVLLTRSDICHGGYGGIKGHLRLSGRFHNNDYEDRERRGDLNYLIEPDDWQKHISKNALLKGGKAKHIQPTSIVADGQLKNEVGNIPTLLHTFYAFSESFIDVLGQKWVR